MTEKAKIKTEGKLIGVRVKNKKKRVCIRGHRLPHSRIVDGRYRRVCTICQASRREDSKNSKR